MTQTAAADLLDRADAARAAGRGDVAASMYDEAITAFRARNELEGWTRAALGAASVYLFGAEPGKLPAQLYDLLARTTDDGNRARVAAALARCWAYAGQVTRAVRFADDAVEHARRVDTPDLLADCLDAALAAHWGPDELDVRRSLAAQLDDVAAHVLDPDSRLQSHMWGLQIACETLDIPAMHRQMRALELLGEESARARFFAASRRLMLDLLRGRTDTAAHLMGIAAAAAEEASLADAWMVLKAMEGYSAAQTGDVATCAAGAEECEALARSEGITVLHAEAAFLWVCAGRLDRARMLTDMFHGSVLEDLPRDVNWLLTLQCVLEAALATHDRDLIENAVAFLQPYEGRAVVNAGAVMFHGVTDDTLARAAADLGDHVTADRLRSRALTTYERLGAQWWRDRLARSSTASDSEAGAWRRRHLHPISGGLWLVGPDERAVPLRGLRGFGYLRELLRRPGQPVAALDLTASGTGVVIQSGLGDLLDHQALVSYRERLRDLGREITEAEEWSDEGRLGTLRAERDVLLSELARATGLNGRARTAGSSDERARIAVQKAIAAAINRIASVDQILAGHLRITIHTGLNCSYEPGDTDQPSWILD